MEKNLTYFVNNSSKPYGLIGLITAPFYAMIEMSYNVDNTLYTEIYYLNLRNAGTLWTSADYYDYEIVKDHLNIYTNLENSVDNTAHLFLYFGEDVTGKTTNNYFHLLCRTDIALRGYSYNIKITMKEGNASDFIDMTTTSQVYWGMVYGSTSTLTINDSGFIVPEVLTIKDNNRDLINSIKPVVVADYQMLVLKKDSYSSKMMQFIISAVAYPQNNGSLFIVENSGRKIVYYSNVNDSDFDIYEDTSNIYIVGNAYINIQQLGKSNYVSIVNKNTLPEEAVIINKMNIHTSQDVFSWNTPLAPGNLDYIKGNNGRIYWVNSGGLIDAFGCSLTVRNYGSSTVRPTGNLIFNGFVYFDTTLGKPIWAKTITEDTITWVDATGVTV